MNNGAELSVAIIDDTEESIAEAKKSPRAEAIAYNHTLVFMLLNKMPKFIRKEADVINQLAKLALPHDWQEHVKAWQVINASVQFSFEKTEFGSRDPFYGAQYLNNILSQIYERGEFIILQLTADKRISREGLTIAEHYQEYLVAKHTPKLEPKPVRMSILSVYQQAKKVSITPFTKAPSGSRENRKRKRGCRAICL